MEVEVIDTGRMPYGESYELQLKYFEDLQKNEDLVGTLIITEPDPVITMGIRGQRNEIFLSEEECSKRGIELLRIGRGGKVTYHGPGQIVVYPILNLSHFKKSLRWYVETLEEVVMDSLREIGLETKQRDGIVGVWGSKGKLCAIGVEVKRWKTLHGIAINHTTDLDYFSLIDPCGLGSMGVSSIAREGIEISREKAIEVVISNFQKKFGVKIKGS